MEKAKIFLVDFFSTLSIYDYIGFFITVLLFFLCIVLALLLRHKTWISLLCIFFSFIFLFFGPVFTHQLLQNTFYKSEAKVLERKQLVYSDTLIIRGLLEYKGLKDASHCKLKALVHKQGGNMIRSFVNSIKSFRSVKKEIDQLMTKGDKIKFKMVIEPFNYQGDYNITMDVGCYK